MSPLGQKFNGMTRKIEDSESSEQPPDTNWQVAMVEVNCNVT